MRTLRTIVATVAVTLAASTVAFAGVNGVGERSSAAGTPVKAIAAHQRARLTSASTQAKAKRQRHVVRQRNETRHAHSAQHAYADADRTLARTQTRSSDCASSGNRTCDQTRQQTRDQTCDQTRQRTRDQNCDPTCTQTRDRARDGSGECNGGCGD
jgi:hypothetical protein